MGTAVTALAGAGPKGALAYPACIRRRFRYVARFRGANSSTGKLESQPEGPRQVVDKPAIGMK